MRERLASVLVWSASAVIAAVFLWILGDVVARGVGSLSLDFLTEAPRDAGRQGGIGTIVVSTALLLGVCLAVAVPGSLAAAILLSELALGRRRLGLLVRRSLDLLAAVPSIVFGLFGAEFFGQVLGLGSSILSGGLTLACMVVPFLTRTTEESLRAVPRDQRAAAAALSLSRATTLRSLLLPAAAPGLAAGWVLASGRALAETAALLFTSGYVTRMPGSLFDSGRALSVHVFDMAMNVPGGDRNAYASACVLLVLVVAVDVSAVAGLGAWRARRGVV